MEMRRQNKSPIWLSWGRRLRIMITAHLVLRFLFSLSLSQTKGSPICDWASDRWVPSAECADLRRLLQNHAQAIVPVDTPTMVSEHAVVATTLTQFKELLFRQSLATWRNPGTTIGLMYGALYPALLVGLMFYGRTGNDYPNGANYTSTALFAAGFITPMFFIFLCLPGVYEDRAAFYRETSSGLYSKISFAVSLQLAALPYLLIAATLNSSIVYHLAGFREGGYGYFWIMFTSFLVLAWMQGIAIGALTPSMAVGTAAVMAPLQISNLFSGFLVARDDIGWWFR